GGGAPCFFDNMDYMNHKGTTIYLRFSAGELASRLETAHSTRPLLAGRKGEDLKLFIAQGLEKRETFYNRARYAVSGTVDEIIAKISELATIG
ncbi:MAG TPA: shikimate kinase, partial [Paludibacter sp.]|nr:shikimate kinase [Paludibacter sp.]